jgi:hypothetical protein
VWGTNQRSTGLCYVAVTMNLDLSKFSHRSPTTPSDSLSFYHSHCIIFALTMPCTYLHCFLVHLFSSLLFSLTLLKNFPFIRHLCVQPASTSSIASITLSTHLLQVQWRFLLDISFNHHKTPNFIDATGNYLIIPSLVSITCCILIPRMRLD